MLGLAVLGSMGGAPVAGASGGGACPPPITNGNQTKARIQNYCYESTVIHVRPGDSVTWVNRDQAPHSVTGANRAWGSYKKLRRGGTMTYRFNRAGVYPYYCVLHIGMVGTVVVRDGRLPEPLDRKEAAEAVQKIPVGAASSDGPVLPAGAAPSWDPWVIIAAGSLAVAGLAATARRRRYRHGRTDPDQN